MFTYIFSGVIHPKRASFSVGTELPFILKHSDFNIDAEATLKFDSSVFTARLRSITDYRNDPVCNLETLKNCVEDNIRLVVDAFCYVKSFSYDVEIVKVICDELNVDYTFGVKGEWNIEKECEETNREFTNILRLFDRPERIFLKDVLADFRRAIKYPSMTGGFCFRAIETIRKFYFEDHTITDEKARRDKGWITLRDKLKIDRNDFGELEKFALPNRHGEYPKITYVERERILNFTRTVIDRFVDCFMSLNNRHV